MPSAKRPASRSPSASRTTDWRKRFLDRKEPKLAVLDTDFAGIKAGSTIYIATPGIIANYIAAIPRGEVRTIVRLRNELARQHGASATCLVTTAIFLRIVCEAAWNDLGDGAAIDTVVPFWRVVEPGSPVAKRLRCDSAWIKAMRENEHLA
jgi:hypothetical protein